MFFHIRLGSWSFWTPGLCWMRWIDAVYVCFFSGCFKKLTKKRSPYICCHILQHSPQHWGRGRIKHPKIKLKKNPVKLVRWVLRSQMFWKDSHLWHPAEFVVEVKLNLSVITLYLSVCCFLNSELLCVAAHTHTLTHTHPHTHTHTHNALSFLPSVLQHFTALFLTLPSFLSWYTNRERPWWVSAAKAKGIAWSSASDTHTQAEHVHKKHTHTQPHAHKNLK